MLEMVNGHSKVIRVLQKLRSQNFTGVTEVSFKT